MKSVFSKILPFVFIAMLGFAPLPAHAGPYTGAGSGQGMFDCLGDLDWGCKIIGFLFETTDRGNDNSVTYVKDGKTVTEQPTILMSALREMMRFFSNALLIIASVKLLYELIQMTAETAQTGQVGGKDTNKLWAPIRLVIAIGLLVPLDTGLNSGQYIVLQMAKWGSGMASQAWKVFTAKLSDGEALTAATAPRIRTLAVNTMKSYACQKFVNYYAELAKLPDALVKQEVVPTDNSTQAIFRNNIDNDVCGTIRYNVPTTNPGNSSKDSGISFDLTKANYQDFMNTTDDLRLEGITWAKSFVPEGRNFPRPTSEVLEQIITKFQDRMKSRIEENATYAKQAMDAITTQIQNAASTRGWTSAGSWFLAITRAQGQIINGAANIPEATGPNIKVLKNYPSAYADYLEFEKHLNQGKRPQDSNNALTPGSPSVGTTVGDETKAELTFWDYPAEGLFWVLDKIAIQVGLWDADPKKAFGDLGASTNPFGEIAALGHKKIQLALRYVGLAVAAAGTGLISNIIGSIPALGPAGKLISGTVGGLSSGATAIFMMFATLFLLAGILLAYIVPLFPFTRFFFSILNWLGSLIEAMILVPMMALGFLTPKGEGFTGPNTRNAIFIIFQLFLRPILSLFGLMCAMLMFYVAAKFLNASFYEATSGVGVYEGHGMRFMQKLVFSVMYVGLIYSAANMSFKMIEHIPKHALRWMGGSASEENYDDHSNFVSTVGAVSGTQLLNQLSSLPNNLYAPLKNTYEGIQKARDSIQKGKDDEKATAANNRRSNMQLLGAGGQLRDDPNNSGKKMSLGAADAIAMPVGSPAQIMNARQDIQDKKEEARGLEAEIDNDVSAYAAASGDPALQASLKNSIQSKVSRLHAMNGVDKSSVIAGLTPPTPLARDARGDQMHEIYQLTKRKNDLEELKPIDIK